MTDEETEKTDPAATISSSVHWLKEAAKSLIDAGEYDTAMQTLKTLDIFVNQIPDKYRAIVGKVMNPLNLTPQEMGLISGNQKIMAIKEVRARTGLGLKHAKDLVEAYIAVCSGGNFPLGAGGGAFAGHVTPKGEFPPNWTPDLSY